MLGALIGDIAGSRFEWNNCKSKDFEFWNAACRPTDDSIMSLAVAQAICDCDADPRRLGACAVRRMQELGRHYPEAGYGGRFRRWLASDCPRPYGSFGNGAAMRVSPCGYAARTVVEAKLLARAATEVTHNHPEGIRGAEATAVAVFLARSGNSMEEIRRVICNEYYPISFTLDQIRPDYSFDVTCQGSVPQAMEAFFESTGFEDAIRNAISIGGDSDTIAAITGSVAQAYYGIPDAVRRKSMDFLDEHMRKILHAFEETYMVAEPL